MKLDHNLIKNVSNPRSPHILGTYGFTMIETLVAGIILLVVLVVVSRISILSITSGRNRVERDRIEAAILNNIQALQQADTKLTFDSIPTNKQKYACLNPAKYLKEQLSQKNGIDLNQKIFIDKNSTNFTIQRQLKVNNPRLLVVVYLFSAPESSIKNERRIIELNPHFYNECIL